MVLCFFVCAIAWPSVSVCCSVVLCVCVCCSVILCMYVLAQETPQVPGSSLFQAWTEGSAGQCRLTGAGDGAVVSGAEVLKDLGVRSCFCLGRHQLRALGTF